MTHHYRKIFDSLSLSCLLLKPLAGNFVIKDATKKYCEVLGRPKEELLGFVIPEIFPENPAQSGENAGLFLELLNKTKETGHSHCIGSIRYDIYNPVSQSFEKRYWTVENVPILNERETEVEYILHTVIDKTQEVLREESEQNSLRELENTAEQKRHFIDSNPDGLFSLDTHGNFLNVNEGLVKITETGEQDLLKMNFQAFCSSQERDHIFQLFQKTVKGEKQEFDADCISAKGRKRVLRFSLVPMNFNGKVCGAYGIARDVTENKVAQDLIKEKEKELKKREVKHNALIQDSFDLVGVLDISGNYKYVSKSSEKVLGVAPKEYIGKSAFDFIHPEDKDRVISNFANIEFQKQIKIDPFRFTDGEGNWRWLETNVTNMLNDPYIDGIVANSREVTDLIKKADEVEELNERYKLAASATGDLIYDWNLVTDKVVRFFKGKEKQFGYELKELDKRDFWRKHIHPEELEGLRTLLKNSLSNPSRSQIRSQYRFRRADGSYAHLIDRGMIVRDEKGKAIRLIGATSDISGIVDRKNALRVANTRFSYAMKATQEMIWDWDIANNKIERSKSFKKIIGKKKDNHPSPDHCWFEKIVSKDQERVKESLHNALRDPEISKWKEEYRISKQHGEKAYVIDRGYIIRDSSGKAIRMVGATLDVTESRRMLKEIKKQNKILKEVAWEQAHIVRAPLARIKGLLELFEDGPNDEWEQDEILQLIKDSAEELDGIVANIIRKAENI